MNNAFEKEFHYIIDNIDYDVLIRIFQPVNDKFIYIQSDWEPDFKTRICHDFLFNNDTIDFEIKNYPEPFQNHCNNLLNKFLKLKAFT